MAFLSKYFSFLGENEIHECRKKPIDSDDQIFTSSE